MSSESHPREPTTESCAECGGRLPKAHRPTCSTRAGETWRIFRYEHPDGRFCELASPQSGIADQVNLPPGFQFVCTVPLTIASDATQERADG